MATLAIGHAIHPYVVTLARGRPQLSQRIRANALSTGQSKTEQRNVVSHVMSPFSDDPQSMRSILAPTLGGF